MIELEAEKIETFKKKENEKKKKNRWQRLKPNEKS